jgi:hypothetical protein
VFIGTDQRKRRNWRDFLEENRKLVKLLMITLKQRRPRIQTGAIEGCNLVLTGRN